jgi:APA family basic amino acid/polyamine antiporter
MDHDKRTKLSRKITLPMLVFYGLGNIFGAGIYVLIGEMAGIADTYIPLSFLIACIVVTFTALSYAELSARYPLSAGEAVYINEGFNSKILSIFVGLTIAFTGLLSSATILHGFHGYLSTFIQTPAVATTLIVVIVISTIAIWGISQSMIVTALLTLLETFGLSMVIYVGYEHIPWDHTTLQTFIPPLEISILNSIILGAFLAFYAFIGFEDMVNVAEEVKDPNKTMHKAIITTLIIATIFYIAIALVSISVVPVNELADSSAPLAKVYMTATQGDATLLSTIAMFAVVNGALIQIIMVSRIFYGMSRQGWLPKFLGVVSPKTTTPVNATALAGFLVFALAISFPILTLAQSTSLLIFIIFTLVNVSLIRIKRKIPHPSDVSTYPMWVPVTAVILNMIMLGFQIISGF